MYRARSMESCGGMHAHAPTRTLPLPENLRLRQLELWRAPEGICDGITACVKCSSKKVTHRDVQLRSGDEGMTVVCHCTICGHTFTL